MKTASRQRVSQAIKIIWLKLIKNFIVDCSGWQHLNLLINFNTTKNRNTIRYCVTPKVMQKEVQNTSYEVFLPNIENESIKPLSTAVQETQGTEEHVKQHSGDISVKSSTWKTLQMTHFLQKINKIQIQIKLQRKGELLIKRDIRDISTNTRYGFCLASDSNKPAVKTNK